MDAQTLPLLTRLVLVTFFEQAANNTMPINKQL